MAIFVYEARKPDGDLDKDTIEAPNLRVATQRLQEQHFKVILLVGSIGLLLHRL